MVRTPTNAASHLLCALLAAGALACTVGESNGAGGGGDDDGTPTIDGGDGSGSDASAADCDPAVTEALPSGNHNPGLSCVAAGCHGDPVGVGAPLFTVGGTVYTDIGGTAPLPGATVHLTDANGLEVALVTAQNGNFWSEQDLAFPLTTSASRCPDNRPMVSQVPAGIGSCNQAGCHEAMRIYLQP